MSERFTTRDALAWLLALASALVACSDAKQPEQVGGDTHWLAVCDDDRECGRGSCTCGLCTESCSGDAQCEGAVPARCYQTASPGVQAACASGRMPDSETTAICLADCMRDAECMSGQWCVAGACVQSREPPTQPGAQDASVPASASGLPTTRASDFADLTSSVSFDDPAPTFPEPERVFVGTADALLGTWTTPGCDPADSETWNFLGGCATIIISRGGPNGEIKGELRVRDAIDYHGDRPNWQQFAPATDPERGYPVEVEPKDYFQIGINPSFGPYSLLDPFFDGTRLTFWLAPMELWDGWCKLQTSYRVPDGDPPYQCVPDGAAYGDPEVDLGKLVLCTNEWSAGSCELTCEQALSSCVGTTEIGCNCATADKQGPDWERPECTPANCRCDEHGCTANWYENRLDVEATWDGEAITMRDGWGGNRAGTAQATLVRESAP